MAPPGPRRPSTTSSQNGHPPHHHRDAPSYPSGTDDIDLPPPYANTHNADHISSSLLEPRIAVVLNVPKAWRPWLFACRLLSIGPHIFWALSPAVTLLVQIIPVAVPGGKKAAANLAAAGLANAAAAAAAAGAAATGGLSYAGGGVAGGAGACPPSNWPPAHPAIPFPWTEMSLGLMWCGASAYLSFFFIDCLMSRWLINYTPSATIIRILTMNATNAFLTERILTFSGGFEDPRLLLPGWVTIATTLTIAYHITQRSINIKKETSTSINIFSIASFISMVSLLAHLHYNGSDYPEKPFESLARLLLELARNVVGDGIIPASFDSSSTTARTEL
ncbi:hypothetical protein CGMCC3_g5580 [Colletotrichum fructicola]|uniref:N-glycosylation protein eos1 n=1 Tax=Colletotrichum fructicola (strain Nara gc5) TaxID=1213859 RepID=A0A7J6IWE0_COLFN|nr:uncharacterized protein CGMCC3_g5580 [Colletotrichum fructicola]KAE9578513.1 hypothetical protein CGMCC3_g5580 [Colletotrichum fructicola]KAF4426254.1 N-glycosylation protein eos1 [Colletotrichum fructicola]KAF4480291.1 N-glycosylation protein eos1 [Colletotrichum fructicola Nara gc5]KAF4885786.1 N-glycosylation protein eos1 [Colletotrichum fructicola]